MKRTVIIGGVAGGASAAARLRRLEEESEIIVLERGLYVSFANCGLPYYVGHVIREQRKLELMTPRRFLARFNIDVRINHEALIIDRENKKVQVRDINKQELYYLDYNYLILSPGASPIIPPFKGIDEVPVFTLRTIPDALKIREFSERTKIKHATIIGGGFIGLEMAENLKKRGIKVKIIEMVDQVMPNLDKEIAQFIHQELLLNGVCLQLGDPVEYFKRENDCNYVIPRSGKNIETDLIILSIGIKPESKLAEESDLELSPKGHIIVNENLQTSDPAIYAVGDAVQVKQYTTGNPIAVPLAGPANKQGRIAADNIAGRNVKFKGVLGAAVVKVFDLTIASVGLTEKQLLNSNIKYEKVYVHPNNHAGYYPEAVPITLKLIFDIPSGKVLGAQAVGGSGTDKRIDVISTVIKYGGTVFDLEELELTYAPPFNSAKDPVNMAGFVASNVLRGDHPIWHWHDINKVRKNGGFLLDVRTAGEFKVGTIDNAVNISDLELRERLEEIPKDKEIYTFCQVGFRGYLATRLLMQKGFQNVFNLTGGYKLFNMAQATTEEIAAACGPPMDIMEEMIKEKSRETTDHMEIDASGLSCPGPLNAMIKGLEVLSEDKKLKVYATDPGFKSSVEAYARLNDAVKLLELTKDKGKIVAILQKGKVSDEDIEKPVTIRKKTRKELRGSNAPSISEISVGELYDRFDMDELPPLLLDVRTPQEYQGGHIINARSLPLGDLMQNIEELEDYKDEEIVSICHSGARSMLASRLLAQAGFKDIRNLTGGMMMWRRKDYPISRK